ncbi:MAG: glycosyltransferase [Alphaproteobacteria bacterium]|nr:glycosyltransferase [Alphaproteobacteria bacterium]
MAHEMTLRDEGRQLRICVLANAQAVHTRRWATAYAARGHEVHVLSIRHEEIEGVRVHAVSVGPVNAASRIWTLLSYLRLMLAARGRLKRISPDVVHAHYTITHGVIAAVSGFHPRIVSAWGRDVIWDGAGRMPTPLRWLNMFALRRSDLVCSTSRFMCAHVNAFMPPGREVQHVPFGVDPDVFAPARDDGDRGDNQVRIGFVKTLKPKYGPDILIRAMPQILSGVPGAQLIIAGRGPMRRELLELARELGVADRVEFLGFVPHDEVAGLMRTFDVSVNCSVFPSESFGVAILEASACGVPVVVTRVGGVTEACQDGETGLLVEPRSSEALARAIIHLAEDPASRSRMGQAGRAFVVENYQWAACVDRMLTCMTEMLGRSERQEGQEPWAELVADRK